MPSDQKWGVDHTGIGVANIEKSAAFYDLALAPLGLTRAAEIEDDGRLQAVGYGKGDYPVYWIDVFHAHSQRHHTAFIANSERSVSDFHSAALKAGGTDNGAPGPRPMYPSSWRVAFVLDPDGNNIEAIWHGDDRH